MTGLLIYLLIGTVLVGVLNAANNFLVKNGYLKKEDSVDFAPFTIIILILLWPVTFFLVALGMIWDRNHLDDDNHKDPDNFAY